MLQSIREFEERAGNKQVDKVLEKIVGFSTCGNYYIIDQMLMSPSSNLSVLLQKSVSLEAIYSQRGTSEDSLDNY